MEKQYLQGWETTEKIGSGGFGTVYRIEKDDMTGHYVSALKVITIPQASDNYEDEASSEEEMTTMLKDQLNSISSEIKIMAQFKGISNIVSYEDHVILEHPDHHGWDVCIRMELLTSLTAHVKESMMTEADVIRLGKDICAALTRFEQKNVIHRDIKPQNIFVNESGDFKLGDFGIARAMERTSRATKIGTYSYMAPEVMQAKPYNHQADIYSLGLVLYWLMNEKKLPFLPLDRIPTGMEREAAQARRINGEKLPAPAHASAELSTVILRACEADRAVRYQSAEEMLNALNQIGKKQFSHTDTATKGRTIGNNSGYTAPNYSGRATEKSPEASGAYNPYESTQAFYQGKAKNNSAQATGNQPGRNPSGRNSSTMNQPGRNPSGGNSSTMNQPRTDSPTGKASTGNAGSGVSTIPTIPCPLCGGTGNQWFSYSSGKAFKGIQFYQARCTLCRGNGQINPILYKKSIDHLNRLREVVKSNPNSHYEERKNCAVCHGFQRLPGLKTRLGLTSPDAYGVVCPLCHKGKMNIINVPVAHYDLFDRPMEEDKVQTVIAADCLFNYFFNGRPGEK